MRLVPRSRHQLVKMWYSSVQRLQCVVTLDPSSLLRIDKSELLAFISFYRRCAAAAAPRLGLAARRASRAAGLRRSRPGG